MRLRNSFTTGFQCSCLHWFGNCWEKVMAPRSEAVFAKFCCSYLLKKNGNHILWSSIQCCLNRIWQSWTLPCQLFLSFCSHSHLGTRISLLCVTQWNLGFHESWRTENKKIPLTFHCKTWSWCNVQDWSCWAEPMTCFQLNHRHTNDTFVLKKSEHLWNQNRLGTHCVCQNCIMGALGCFKTRNVKQPFEKEHTMTVILHWLQQPASSAISAKC